MSYDRAVWIPSDMLSDEQALRQYHQLCKGDTNRLIPHPSIGNFYLERYAIHPEIDDVSKDKQDDFDFSPWSVEHDVSDRHLIMSCVWSHADHIHHLVLNLAQKHGLAVFYPQLVKIHYPTDQKNKY